MPMFSPLNLIVTNLPFRAYARQDGFFAVISLQSSLCVYRGRMISAHTAVTEFTGSHNAAPTDFSAVISQQSSLCFYRGRIISAPTAVTEFTGSHNAAPADFSAVISAQSRTEKNLSEQGAGFRARGRVLCVRNRANGFLQRSYGKLFPQSDHSISDMAMALILTV